MIGTTWESLMLAAYGVGALVTVGVTKGGDCASEGALALWCGVYSGLLWPIYWPARMIFLGW